jgi:hypothetical protein
MKTVSSGSTGFAVLRREANEGGFFRPIVEEVIERYLDCGNPRCGFALMIRCRLMRTAKRCPYPVSGVWRGAARHVFLPHPWFLPLVSCQAAGGVGRVGRIIDHLKLSFVADRPPPPHIACQELLMADETSAEYFS